MLKERVTRNLLIARHNAGISQEKAAEKVNVTCPCISHYENGHRQPTFEMIEKLAQAYNVPVEFFFTWQESENND